MKTKKGGAVSVNNAVATVQFTKEGGTCCSEIFACAAVSDVYLTAVLANNSVCRRMQKFCAA